MSGIVVSDLFLARVVSCRVVSGRVVFFKCGVGGRLGWVGCSASVLMGVSGFV